MYERVKGASSTSKLVLTDWICFFILREIH